MNNKKIFKSFTELSTVLGTKSEDKIIKEKVKKEKKEKELYAENNIIRKGSQLATNDYYYETYSTGIYTSWRITMLGKKNGAVDIGNNISDGNTHSAFHDKAKAVSMLINLINDNKIK